MTTAVDVTFELADFLDPGQRVDLHEGVGDTDDMHHVHNTLTDREAGKHSSVLMLHTAGGFNDASRRLVSMAEVCLTVWTACHSPTSFLKSNTFTMVSAAGQQTHRET